MDLRKFVPSNWTEDSKIIVPKGTKEYNLLSENFGNSDVNNIYRVQNVYRYNMFLIRQQHLLALNPEKEYYLDRRYVEVDKVNSENALLYNLESRIKGPPGGYKFRKNLQNTSSSCNVYVVSVVTSNPNDELFIPTRDSDFYIEYVIDLH